jgi:hypothetical protein
MSKGNTIINLYAPNASVSNFIKHTLKDLKAFRDSNTVVVGYLNTMLSKQKLNKEILDLNDTIYQMDQTDAYRILHPTKAQ